MTFFDDPVYIIVLSIVFQMIGGIGNGINNSASMALLSSYKDKREDYIGYFELCAGLGCLFGPLMGSIFYGIFGYLGPFLGLGLIQSL